MYSLIYHILLGSGRLCNWLSLWCLVLWINHLSPVCRSTFWKFSFKRHLVCKFDIMEKVFFIVLILLVQMYLHLDILQYNNTCFCLPYFHVSNGALFLQSTTHGALYSLFALYSYQILNVVRLSIQMTHLVCVLFCVCNSVVCSLNIWHWTFCSAWIKCPYCRNTNTQPRRIVQWCFFHMKITTNFTDTCIKFEI